MDDFRIYVPEKIIGSPSLDGLSGALWEGFGAATDPETASTFWTAVATFCYTETWWHHGELTLVSWGVDAGKDLDQRGWEFFRQSSQWLKFREL